MKSVMNLWQRSVTAVWCVPFLLALYGVIALGAAIEDTLHIAGER